MEQLPENVQTLLKDLRVYLANSNDPWESRRALMYRINEVIGGGESEVFVANVRELSRIGASYAEMMQTFQRLLTSYSAGGATADLFARAFAPNPFAAAPMNEFLRQLTELFNAQSAALRGGETGKKG
ncbi:MAG: hypothetical protein KatS3mg123_2220 [Burkholderiales bacterium]|nr:MAG: hypothetical protein KatS3mg123_2220 [Burkholderiales bacterium]